MKLSGESSPASAVANLRRPEKKRLKPTQLRVCIKVPSVKHSAERIVYDSLNGPNKREKWVRYLLGEHRIYVDRPKNDGGWFQVPQVKQGSFLANPFPLKQYSLEGSLYLYERYLQARLKIDGTLEDLILQLQEKEQRLATECFIKSGGKRGKSMLHLQLDVRGEACKIKLSELQGSSFSLLLHA